METWQSVRLRRAHSAHRDARQALTTWRFATGFMLAGIYSVGMKIASQWYRQGLGAILGFLVGALVQRLGGAHIASAQLAVSGACWLLAMRPLLRATRQDGV